MLGYSRACYSIPERTQFYLGEMSTFRWSLSEGDEEGTMDIMKYPKKALDGAISIKNSVVNGFGRGVDTVTGKAVIEHVAKFAQETDAVNTAIVTRIYQILDRQTMLEQEIKDAKLNHNRTRILGYMSIALNACCIFAIVYILKFVRGK